MMLSSFRKKLINSILTIDDEYNHLRSLIKSLKLSPNHKVLDVGCGYGKNLSLLCEIGLNALGVEVNQTVVAKNLDAGMKCITVKEFDALND